MSRGNGEINSKSLEYTPDVEASIPRRLALFLVWAARKYPKRAISLPLAAKVVMILGRTPPIDGKEVQRLRGSISAARKILLSEYSRGLINVPGAGLRATIDSEDQATTEVERAARRVVSSIEQLDRNRAAVKLSDISNPDVRHRVQRVTTACKPLTSGEVLEKLRLPSETKP